MRSNAAFALVIVRFAVVVIASDVVSNVGRRRTFLNAAPASCMTSIALLGVEFVAGDAVDELSGVFEQEVAIATRASR